MDLSHICHEIGVELYKGVDELKLVNIVGYESR